MIFYQEEPVEEDDSGWKPVYICDYLSNLILCRGKKLDIDIELSWRTQPDHVYYFSSFCDSSVNHKEKCEIRYKYCRT